VVAKLGRRFGLLLTAAGISNLGDGLMGAALPLLVAALTRDPVLVAAATFAGRLPWLLFAVPSGALVDRMDRRRVLVVANVVRAGLVGGLTWAIVADAAGLWLVYVVAFALGVCETFFDTSAEAFVPSLVETKLLPAANSRLQVFEWVGNAFMGPPLGAALFGFAAGLPFGLNAASFAASAALIAAIGGSRAPTRDIKAPLGSEIKEGLVWLWNQRVVRTLALMAGVTNLVTFGIIAIFVLFAQDVLGIGDAGYGILLATLGVGGLLGAVFAPRVVRRLGPGVAAQSTVVIGVVLNLILGSTSNPWVAGAVLFTYGLSITLWNVVSVSLRQTLTPDHLRGRVAGASRLVTWGAQPVGAVLGGVVAGWLGLRAPFFVASAGLALTFLLTLRLINNRTIADAEAGA
jgi:MFS family permease